MNAPLLSTPGPWYWHDDGFGRTSIRTPDRGNLIVVDFGRKGMQSATPRFAHWTGLFDGAPRERKGGILIDGPVAIDLKLHPDARLIVTAPRLLVALQELHELLDAICQVCVDNPPPHGIERLENARRAIAEATGTQEWA